MREERRRKRQLSGEELEFKLLKLFVGVTGLSWLRVFQPLRSGRPKFDKIEVAVGPELEKHVM